MGQGNSLSLAALFAIASAGCIAGGGSGAEPQCTAEPGKAPADLACTGLYADMAMGALSPGVSSYEPAYSLWADGADKRRFVMLPPGSTIDTTEMDHWVFPAGTKLWKEFSLGGRRIETRYLEKNADGTWLFTTYAWSADQTRATQMTEGAHDVRGSGYDIPPTTECIECHKGARDRVLGFEAIGLSMAGASGLTLDALVRQRKLTAPPEGALTVPGDAATVAALGWLHANCGNACHNRNLTAGASFTGMFLRLTVADLRAPAQTDTYATAVGVASSFQPAAGDHYMRIDPGHPENSAVVFRASARDGSGGMQMPPIATHVPDRNGMAALTTWIAAM